jgi:hypothetical protein
MDGLARHVASYMLGAQSNLQQRKRQEWASLFAH